MIKKRASWLDIVWKAVHQLSIVYPGREYFHYYQDICRYIEEHWQRLAEGKERTSTWANTVSSTITTHKRIFKPGPDQGYWGLRQRPHDDTPLALLEEIRASTDGVMPRTAWTASSPQSRRKRKTGWGEKPKAAKKAKRTRVVLVAADSESSLSSTDSFESNSNSAADEPIDCTNMPQLLAPLLPPIFPTHLKDDEEEFVDIEGVSEEEVFYSTPSPEQYSFDYEYPSFEPNLCGSSTLFDEISAPSEEWFQSLFVQ